MTMRHDLLPWTEAVAYELPGFEPDSYLAFVALLGLLRSIERSQPDWQPRIAWDPTRWRVRLCLAESVDRDAIVDAVVESIRSLGVQLGGFHAELRVADAQRRGTRAAGKTRAAHEDEVSESKTNENVLGVSVTASRFRTWAERAGAAPELAPLLASLGCEHPPTKEGHMTVSGTVLTRGAGHQRFLKTFFAYVAPAGEARDTRSGQIARALWQSWRRKDEHGNFRWDPRDDRRHALRARAPDKDKATGEAGALALAAVGFLSLASAPTQRALLTRGVRRVRRRVMLSWPLTERPLARLALEVLLGHHAVVSPSLDSGGRREARELGELHALGVAELMEAPVIVRDKYRSVGRGRPQLGLLTDARP